MSNVADPPDVVARNVAPSWMALLSDLELDSEFPQKETGPENAGRKPASPHLLSSEIQFDGPGDTKYARDDVKFSRVAHIFHQEWHGIRSAAGVLPGHKVAIPLNLRMGGRQLIQIFSHLNQWRVEKVVFHGFSPVARAILRPLKLAGFSNYLVWHGNLSQLVWEPEVHFFQSALDACRRGYFRRSHMLKAHMDSIFPNAFVPMLYNSPPVLSRRRSVRPFQSARKIALVSAPPDIRKNLYSNIVGACLSRSVTDVFHYSKVKAKIPAMAKAQRIIYGGHEQHFTLLQNIDVSVNVTTIDCHPMVDLEAIGAGAFPITGPLFLDCLAKHTLTQLSEVTNPFDVSAIARKIDLVSAVNGPELDEIISDYSKQLAKLSNERYAEFLQL